MRTGIAKTTPTATAHMATAHAAKTHLALLIRRLSLHGRRFAMPTFVYGDYEPREYPDLPDGQGGVKTPGDEVTADTAPDFRWEPKKAAPSAPPAPTVEPPAAGS